MRKLFRAIYSQKLLAGFILLFQIFILGAGFIWLKDYSKIVFGSTTVLSIVLVIYEVNRKVSPEFKMTWLVLVSVIPVFGVLFYIYLRFGGFLTREIAQTNEKARLEIDKAVGYDDELFAEINQNDPAMSGLVHYLDKIALSPPYSNTSVKYYELGEKMYEDMKKAMENAHEYIFLEFFILNASSSIWAEVFDTLCRKVREGVEVRLMYDGLGSFVGVPKGMPQILDNAGIKHAVFAPVQPLLSSYQNNRDHRKIIVIDGETAFTGGINLADEYVNRIERFGHWKDNGIRLEGDAVTRITGLFLEMWNTVNYDNRAGFEKYLKSSEVIRPNADGYVIPFGDNPLNDNTVGKRVYIDIINTAAEYVHIMTPYLIIDSEMMEALHYAVDRGVDVRIIIPHKPDKVYAYWLAHTYYPELIAAGVKIYEYAPGFIHAKTVVSDNKKAIVGSINFDYRSLYLHYENAVLIFDAPVVLDIEKDFDETTAKSMRITAAEYKKFNILTRFAGRAIKIIAPLL